MTCGSSFLHRPMRLRLDADIGGVPSALANPAAGKLVLPSTPAAAVISGPQNSSEWDPGSAVVNADKSRMKAAVRGAPTAHVAQSLEKPSISGAPIAHRAESQKSPDQLCADRAPGTKLESTHSAVRRSRTVLRCRSHLISCAPIAHRAQIQAIK